MTVGVLALQGSVSEHLASLRRLGLTGVPVKTVPDLSAVDRLILPGGESTTLAGLLKEHGLATAIRERARGGMPIWGTCAGMILLARRIVGQEEGGAIGVMDIAVRRNAYGAQIHSFRTEAAVAAFGAEPLPLVFIRAPYIVEAGPNVDILLRLNGNIVAAQEGNLLATSFHPELTDDLRVHRYFLAM